MTIASADLIAGLAKGLAVLESFDMQRQRLNATLAAQRTGLTRAAARRHLLTLAHLGYLESDGSYFWLSPRVLRFSGSYLASARLPRLVQPTLNQLALKLRQPCSVVVLDNDEVVIVARSNTSTTSDMHQLSAYGLHLGARLPAHATSTGRMLLASKSQSEWQQWRHERELPRLTPHTVTQMESLAPIIEQVREQDWCYASGEHELSVHAVAIPLRDMQGRTVAALNVVLHRATAFDEDALVAELLPHMLDAARQVRGQL